MDMCVMTWGNNSQQSDLNLNAVKLNYSSVANKPANGTQVI